MTVRSNLFTVIRTAPSGYLQQQAIQQIRGTCRLYCCCSCCWVICTCGVIHIPYPPTHPPIHLLHLPAHPAVTPAVAAAAVAVYLLQLLVMDAVGKSVPYTGTRYHTCSSPTNPSTDQPIHLPWSKSLRILGTAHSNELSLSRHLGQHRAAAT